MIAQSKFLGLKTLTRKIKGIHLTVHEKQTCKIDPKRGGGRVKQTINKPDLKIKSKVIKLKLFY
jgi:hypothetical protein